MQLKQERINFRLRRDFGEVMNVAMMFIHQNFKELVKNILFFLSPILLIISVLTSYYNNLTPEAFSNEIFINTQTTIVLIIFLSFWIGHSILLTVSFAFLLSYIKGETNDFSLQFIWNKVKKVFWRSFINIFFSFFVLILSSIIIFFFLFFLGLMVENFTNNFKIFAFIIAIILFLLIVLLTSLLAAVINFSFFISLEKETNYFKSLIVSIKIVFRFWKETAIIQTVSLGLVFSLFLFPFLFLFFYALTQHIFTSHSIQLLEFIVRTIATILFLSIMFLAGAFNIIIMASQYFNLIEKMESVGLMIQIENLHHINYKSFNTLADLDEEGF